MPRVLITARYFAVDPEPIELLRAHGCELVHAEIDWTFGDGNLSEGRAIELLLDVFHREPLQHNPFQGLDNVVLSPHLAAYSREGLRDTGVLAAHGVVTVLGGGRPDVAILINPEIYA
jgi:D-3-phosphoglycerate dehydrogenase